MKTLELDELKKMSADKLQNELESAKKALFEIKFKVNNGESKSGHLIKSYRRYVARINTLMPKA